MLLAAAAAVSMLTGCICSAETVSKPTSMIGFLSLWLMPVAQKFRMATAVRYLHSWSIVVCTHTSAQNEVAMPAANKRAVAVRPPNCCCPPNSCSTSSKDVVSKGALVLAQTLGAWQHAVQQQRDSSHQAGSVLGMWRNDTTFCISTAGAAKGQQVAGAFCNDGDAYSFIVALRLENQQLL